MASSDLPLGYRDPATFIDSPDFNQTLSFSVPFAQQPQTVSYAVAGAQTNDAVTLFWIGGMGQHRLSVHFVDRICEMRNVRIVVMDRPGGGKSTFCPLAQRFEWSYEAFLAILRHLDVRTVHLMSHSNGLLYSLYTLLRLFSDRDGPVECKSWSMTGPYVPPWLSGHVSLTVARYVPAVATGQLGPLMSVFTKLVDVVGWSSGVASSAGRSLFSLSVQDSGASVAAASSSSSSADPTAEAAAADDGDRPEAASASDTRRLKQSEREWKQFIERNDKRPYERKTFAGYCRSDECFDVMIDRVRNEGLAGMGQEALVSLALPDARCWGWGVPDDAKQGDKIDESMLYERGFSKLKERLAGRPLLVRVWYGKDDGFVPTKGRRYLKKLLCDKLQLMKEQDWHQVDHAGHDDVVNMVCVMEPLLDEFVIKTTT